MKQLKNYADDRNSNICIYCHSGQLTKEHAPSKILLDEPFPPNLPVVASCLNCNNKYSYDEEYVACLIEVMRTNATNIDMIKRNKIKTAMNKNSKLSKLFFVEDKSHLLKISAGKIKNIFVKLSKSHISFELNELIYNDNYTIRYMILNTEDEKMKANNLNPEHLFPEVGSRLFQKIISNGGNSWQIVQDNQYRYSISYSCHLEVRIIVSEYFYSIFEWFN